MEKCYRNAPKASTIQNKAVNSSRACVGVEAVAVVFVVEIRNAVGVLMLRPDVAKQGCTF